jgi:hypothetical protein
MRRGDHGGELSCCRRCRARASLPHLPSEVDGATATTPSLPSVSNAHFLRRVESPVFLPIAGVGLLQLDRRCKWLELEDL